MVCCLDGDGAQLGFDSGDSGVKASDTALSASL